MAHTKSMYYRTWVDGDGIQRVETAIFPSDGDWVTRYAARGWSQTPPETVVESEAEGDGLEEEPMRSLREIAGGLGITVAAVGAKKKDVVEAIRNKRAQLALTGTTQQ